jgi:hypothetical protein
MIGLIMGAELETAGAGIGPFHVHRGHAFEGFELRPDGVLTAICGCGATLDQADAAFAPCPSCAGEHCRRCGGTGAVVDHAALAWQLPDTT